MTKNILLVDDELITNIVHKSMLERSASSGYIESVNNGQQAIKFLEDRIAEKTPLPDVIFLDINMPVMNGFQFLEELQHHFAIRREAITIIMLSSSIDKRDRDRAKELGVETFICKPLDYQAIDSVLAGDG